MPCHTRSRSSPSSVIARSGATKQSIRVQDGLDCFASLAMTELGIGSYRIDLAVGSAIAGPCPAWQGVIPVFGVTIQPGACIFSVINRQATRIFAIASIRGGGGFSKNLWRRIAPLTMRSRRRRRLEWRLRSGRGEKRLEPQCRRKACLILARRRTIGAASRSRRNPLAASGQRA